MPEEVRVRITGDAADLARATDDATGALGKLGGGAKGLALPLLGVAGVAAGAAVAIADMTMAAAADRDEQEKLRTALIAAGVATNGLEKQMDDAIASGQKLAFTDSEIRDALVPLAGATGDMTTATGLLATAQDVARLTGTDLETAAEAVAKAYGGQEGALTRLIPALAGAEEGTDLIAEAQRLAAGQADTFAASTEGQLASSGIAFDELKETIGSAFLPVLDAIVPILVPLIAKLGELIEKVLPPLIQVLGVAIDALTPIIDALIDLMDDVLPILTPMIDVLGEAIKALGGFMSSTLRFVGDLVRGLQDLLKPIQDVLGGLQGLLDFKMPSFDLPDILPFAAPPAGGAQAQRARGGTVVNIHTGADPQAVVRVVRAHLATNGSL